MTAVGAHYPLTERREPAVMKYDDRVCNGIPNPSVFYPEDYTTPRARKRARDQALAICARCKYTQECLEDALANRAQWGIWGGATKADRDRLKDRGDAA
jgi:WhiB family redox-sensing transcriptional regulator